MQLYVSDEFNNLAKIHLRRQERGVAELRPLREKAVMGKVCANFQNSRNWAVPGDNSDDISNGVGRICNEWTNRITTYVKSK